jgi:hypothetical protein
LAAPHPGDSEFAGPYGGDPTVEAECVEPC